MAEADAILDEARQKFERQAKRLDDVRTRAGGLLSGAAIVTGLFGFRLGSHHGAVRLTFLIVAIVMFVVLVALTMAINWPIKGWNDGVKLGPWIQLLEDKESATLEVFPTELAAQLYTALTENEPLITARMNLIRWVCLALGLEVVCWAIAIGF